MASGDILRVGQGITYEGFENVKVKPQYTLSELKLLHSATYGGPIRADALNRCVWVGIQNGSVTKHDMESGALLVSCSGQGFVRAIKLDYSQNPVIASDASKVTKYNKTTGAQIWIYTVPMNNMPTDIVIDANDNVYVAAGAYLVKLNGSGVQQWAVNPTFSVNGGMVYSKGVCFNADKSALYVVGYTTAPSEYGVCLKINMATGAVISSWYLGGHNGSTVMPFRIAMDEDNYLYVGSQGSSQNAIRKYADGNVNMAASYNCASVNEIIIHEGNVHVATASAYFTLLKSVLILKDTINSTSVGIFGITPITDNFYFMANNQLCIKRNYVTGFYRGI